MTTHFKISLDEQHVAVGGATKTAEAVSAQPVADPDPGVATYFNQNASVTTELLKLVELPVVLALA